MKKEKDPHNPDKFIEVEAQVLESCSPRDDHSACFDKENAIMYVFGGYVSGDKSNDTWMYDLNAKKWTCLHKGDYQLMSFK